MEAVPDPERATQTVRFQRSLDGAAWETVRIDRSSPAYVYYDDLSNVAVGTVIRYRAILTEPDGTRVRSAVRTVTRTAPAPLVNSVTVAGQLQSEIGCPPSPRSTPEGDWDPACAASHLDFDTNDGLWKGTFTIPAGTYEWKVAINDSWDVNYGAGGAAGGSNLPLVVPAGGASVTFVWDQVSKIPSAILNN